MEFKSLVNLHPKHEFAEGGFKKTIDVYEDIINAKTGKMETKKTKEEPFYEKIQEMKESQELDKIIKRYNIDLNDKHITEITDEIVDMTNLPSDLIETYAVTKKLESMFNETTADIKNHFHDFAGFLSSFQKGTLGSELQTLATKRQEVEGTIVESQKIRESQVESPKQPAVQQPVKQAVIQQPVQQPIQNQDLGGYYVGQ